MPKKITILHIDDSNAIILNIKILLGAVSTIEEIENARTVKQAKDIFKNKNIHVAILDIDLPDCNGLELLEWIKQKYPKTIVIMLTNNSNSFFRSIARKSGADYFLDKSMEFEDIIKIVENI